MLAALVGGHGQLEEADGSWLAWRDRDVEELSTLVPDRLHDLQEEEYARGCTQEEYDTAARWSSLERQARAAQPAGGAELTLQACTAHLELVRRLRETLQARGTRQASAFEAKMTLARGPAAARRADAGEGSQPQEQEQERQVGALARTLAGLTSMQDKTRLALVFMLTHADSGARPPPLLLRPGFFSPSPLFPSACPRQVSGAQA